MASLYGVAIGGGLTGNIDDNARKVTRNKFEYGTPDMRLLVIVDTDEGAGSFTTGHGDPNSQLSKAVLALQQQVEIYGISNTDTLTVTVQVRRSSVPLANGEEDGDQGERSILSALVTAATGINCQVFDGEIDGDTIDYDNA